MTSTRWATLSAIVLGGAGIAIASTNESIPVALAGGVLFMAAVVGLLRHFWRQNEANRQQFAATLTASIAAHRLQTETLGHDMQGGLDAASSRADVFTQGILEYLAQLDLDLTRLKRDVAILPKTMNQIAVQLAGVFGLYATLKPEVPYPPFGGWAIAGDCAQRLVTLILGERPKWIIEVGSGLSTLLAAQALDLLGGDGHLFALEHEEDWIVQSAALLNEHALSHRVDILHAPLVEIEINDEPFVWYDLRNVSLPEDVGIIFIDGPPKSTGENARYPAMPLLLNHLSATGVVLMDDASRTDERAAVRRWTEEIPGLEVTFHPDAKGTVEIRRKKG